MIWLHLHVCSFPEGNGTLQPRPRILRLIEELMLRGTKTQYHGL